MVSVVLPFRNAAETLADALRSIREQSLHNFECVLVDNDSADDSTSMARSVCRDDVRFRLIHARGGLVDALNAGFESARTPLVARMDADDVSRPERLRLQVAALTSDPSLSLVGCRVACLTGGVTGTGMRRYVAWLNSLLTHEQIRNGLFVEAPLVHPSVMLRRQAWQSAGGYRDTGGPEDYDLWMRLLLGGHRAARLPEVLLEWRDGTTRLTRAHPSYHADRLFETKLRYLPQVVAASRPLQICGAGPIGRRWSRALAALGYRIVRFVDVDPRKIGRQLHGVTVDPPERINREDGFVLAAVGSPGAREQIIDFLTARGLRAWDDFLAVC